MAEYPSNSISGRSGDVPDVVEVEEAAELLEEKPSLGKTFLRAFFPEGGVKKAGKYVFDQVIVPMSKDMALKAINGAARELLGVDVSRATQALASAVSGSSTPYVQYSNVSTVQATPQSQQGITATTRFDFTRYRFSSYEAASQVLDDLTNIITVQGLVTVEQFMTMIGRQSVHTDTSWGWKSMEGAYVEQHPTGAFILRLPRPLPIKTN